MPVNPVPLDGVSAPNPETAGTPTTGQQPTPPEVRRWKGVVVLSLVFFYVVYGGWSLVLASVLPSRDPSMRQLPVLGLLIALVAGLVFVGIGAVAVQRISRSHADPRSRAGALAKIAAAILPGIALSIIVPVLTMRELPLTLAIITPTNDQLVAPVSLTFSIEAELPSLASSGFVPVEYRWDVNNDRKTDQETTEPALTATFEREGAHAVTVVMTAADGTQRSATKTFAIRGSVFKVTPDTPIVDQLTLFSLSHLYPAEGSVKEIEWDFNGDGIVDTKTSSLDVSHTYFETGSEKVSARVLLLNNTEATYVRTVSVTDAPPLPFPVTLSTQPKTLIGSPPFPILFSVAADIPVAKVEWDFGDGQTTEGVKTAHTFEKKGAFPVNVRVYSQSGVVANLQSNVRVVDMLRIPDLAFEGTPELKSGTRIEAEVPLSLNLTPKTSLPFVVFQWEAPDATEVGSTDTTLQAIYRREGAYTITLIAQDQEDHVLRMPITVVVKPASESLMITMDPETGVAPLDVKFDASESFIPGETITGFVWNFGDGSKEEFAGASVSHTFAKEGTYTVTLRAKTTSGKEYSSRSTIVVREPLLRACITPSRIKGEAPMGVEFTSDCSVGAPTSYSWDFGDGSQSDQKNIIHVFEKPGTYVVKLTVQSADASHTATVSVTATQP